jgi:hypothetical protein
MSDEQVTPALLRADAETMLRWSYGYPLPTATIYCRAAAALEEKAERLEARPSFAQVKDLYERAEADTQRIANAMAALDALHRQAQDADGRAVALAKMSGYYAIVASALTGGRVALGDEEGGDAR